MHSRSSSCVALTALCLLSIGVRPAHAVDPKTKAPREATSIPQQGRKAIERGLVFLEKDAAKWRKERKCSTCHQGTITVWALAEARSRGYPVAAATLADVANWTKERLANIDKPRDKRPGWSMVNSPAV